MQGMQSVSPSPGIYIDQAVLTKRCRSPGDLGRYGEYLLEFRDLTDQLPSDGEVSCDNMLMLGLDMS